VRAYYDIRTEIVPGWRLPAHITVRRGVTLRRNPSLGKTDVLVVYPGKPADPRKWKTLPHVELANLEYSEREHSERERERKELANFWLTGKRTGRRPFAAKHSYMGHQPTVEEVVAFVRTYGVLLTGASVLETDPCEVSVAEFRDLQETVRYAWRTNKAKTLWFNRGAEELDRFDLPFTWVDDEFALHPADLWSYIQLLLTRDLTTGHAKVCKFPRCAAPFCVRKRSDFEFCSHECAVRFTNQKNRMRRRRP